MELQVPIHTDRSGRCVIHFGGTHKTSILSLYTVSTSSALSVGTKSIRSPPGVCFLPSGKLKTGITFDELHRQVELLAVAGLFLRQRVIQRHHLSGREEGVGFMKLDLTVETDLHRALTFIVTSPSPLAVTATF